MADGLVIVFIINCDSTLGKVWLELFEDVIFFILFNIFLGF